ncbi:hypothetical protein ACFV3R_25130 [Streptomyces sp. NPDC059740]
MAEEWVDPRYAEVVAAWDEAAEEDGPQVRGFIVDSPEEHSA